MDVVNEPEQFYQQLLKVMVLLENDKVDIDEWFESELKPLMTLNNHNFLITSLALRQLIERAKENENLYRLKKVTELVEAMANASNNQDVKFLTESARFAYQGKPLSADVINSVTRIAASSGNIAGGDILKLHRIYGSPNPPNVSFIRTLDIMEPLMQQTFSPGHSPNYQAEKLWLISYAAFWNSFPSCKQDIKNGHALLKEVNTLFERVTSMNQIQDHFMTFMNMIKEPICSTAIVIWLKAKFFDDAFYEWSQFSLAEVPPAFHILDEIAITQPSLRPRVFDIWTSLFEREFQLDNLNPRQIFMLQMQYRERFLDRFVHMFHYHYEVPILKYFCSKVNAIDPALIIYFLNNVIPDIEMPMDGEVYGLMMRMLINAPAQSLSASQHVPGLLAFGNHIDLCQEDSELHHQLEAKLL